MKATQSITNSTAFQPILFVARPMRPNFLYAMLLLAVITFGGCKKPEAPAPPAPNEPNTAGPATPAEPNVAPVAPAEPNAAVEAITSETSLFDGKSLGNWKITDFGGQGEVYIKDGAIYMEMGNDMTGINWTGPLIRMNYEITLEAMRFKGSDFFCGLTFPVDDKCCSLVLGGWGGELCGLSNIDYYDAANNETTTMRSFENNKWYRVRLRVTPGKIEAWLDDEVLVNIVVKGRHIDVRAEMDLSQPLGIATWQTGGAARNIVVKPVTGGPLLPSDTEF